MDTKKMNNKRATRYKNNKKARLSNLPDSLLSQILSLVEDTKFAVQTCILSKRWKNLWTHLPSLYLDSEYFKHNDLASFTKFVEQIKARRGEQKIQTLRFWRSIKITTYDDKAENILMDKIIGYAKRCGVEGLETNNQDFFNRCLVELPPMKYLKMQATRYSSCYLQEVQYQDQIYASATYLHLEDMFYVVKDGPSVIDLFSGRANLEKLALINCEFRGKHLKGFMISCPNLVNLTISDVSLFGKVLKISAPKLVILNVINMRTQKLLIEGCPALKKVNFDYESLEDHKEVKDHLNSYINPNNFNSQLQTFFQNDIRRFIPLIKYLEMQHLEFKWIFTKWKNSATIKIYHTTIDQSVATLTWKMDAEQTNTGISEYSWNESDFVDIFLNIGFIIYPTIIYTLNRHEDRFDGLSDVVKKEMLCGLIMAEYSSIRAAFGEIMSNKEHEYSSIRAAFGEMVMSHEELELSEEDGVLETGNWKCGVIRTLDDKVMWEIEDVSSLKK